MWTEECTGNTASKLNLTFKKYVWHETLVLLGSTFSYCHRRLINIQILAA